MEKSQSGSASSEFPTTNWSVVMDAGSGGDVRATVALERLCTRYWHPIYFFIRRSGIRIHEAEDLAQSFFAHLMEKETLKKADRTKGRFRSFLLGSLNFFISNERNKELAQKRGGLKQIIPLDEEGAEELYAKEITISLSPDKLFARQWALTLVKTATDRLREEYQKKGELSLFETLRPGVVGEIIPGAYETWSQSLGLNEGAVRVSLHRLRRRFGELLRSEVAHTVSTPEEVDEEIRHVFAAIETLH